MIMRYNLIELVERLLYKLKKDTYADLEDWETTDLEINWTETIESRTNEKADDPEAMKNVIKFYKKNKDVIGIKKTLTEIGIYDVLFRLYDACEYNFIPPEEAIERICCRGKGESFRNSMGFLNYLTDSDFPKLTKMMFDEGAISEGYYNEMIEAYPTMKSKVLGVSPTGEKMYKKKKNQSKKPKSSKVINITDYLKK
mgnify:FL=1